MYLETGTLGWLLFGALIFFIVSALMGDHVGDHSVEIGSDAGHGGTGFGGDTHYGVTYSELFSIRNLALLVAGFSAASILARNAHLGQLGTNVAGVCGAFGMVVIGIWLFRIIRRQESNSITRNTDCVNKIAVVTTSIPEQGFGEITLRNALGVSTSINAKSRGSAIQAGSEVKIVAVSGNIATVTVSAN